MLTVKHIEPSGHETLWPAIRVAFQPKTDYDRIPPVMWIDRMGERGLVDTIDIGNTGSFYVMNEQGKTIAKYDLGGWDGPAKSATSTTINDARRLHQRGLHTSLKRSTAPNA